MVKWPFYYKRWLGTANDFVDCPASLNNNSSQITDIKLADNAQVGADGADVVPEHVPGFPTGIESRFKNFLDHPVLIQHVDWTGATLESISNDLLGLYLAGAPTQLLVKLRNLFFFRATIRIKIVVQGAPQAMGQMVFAFTPYQLVPAVDQEATIAVRVVTANYTNAKVVPHLIVDPSQTKTYELDLPVCTPNGLYCFNSDYSYGSYSMSRLVFNPLDTGTAVMPTVKICVYMSLVDPVFDGLTTVQMTSNEFVAEKSRPLSAIATALANVSSSVGQNFPILSPFTTLFSKVSTGAGSVLAALGFSRPPELDLMTVNLTRTCDAYSQVDGRSSTIVLAKSQTVSQGISPAYGEGELRDMDIAHICNIPGLIILNNTIAPAAASGALLKSIIVSPLMSRSTGATVTYEPTPLAGVAITHTGWRGDLVYTFEFVASVFHRATVLIAYDPYPNVAAPTLAVALSTLENVTINISGNTCCSIRVPYKQPKPLSRLANKFFADGEGVLRDNGTLFMYLINPVISNGSTAGVDYNVYLHSDNIKFFAPTAHAIHELEVQMTSNEFVVVPTQYTFGSTTDMAHAGYLCFPDVSSSVKEITRKHTFYATDAPSTPAAETHILGFNVPNVRRSSTDTVRMTLVSWYAVAYLGLRGSLSWSFSPTYVPGSSVQMADQTLVVKLAHHVHGESTERLNALAGSVTGFTYAEAYAWTQPNLQVTSRADGVFPFYVPWRFVPCRNIYLKWWDNVQCEIQAEKTSSLVSTEVAIASGDDTTFCWFLGFPVTKLKTT